jgi:hypothetical protein
MPRPWPDHVPLPDGRTVGFRLKRRGEVWQVFFADPAGDYHELSTGANRKADAYPVAAKLILAAYLPTVPRDQRKTTWDEVLAELSASATIRASTRADYLSVVAILRRTVETDGPGDVTAETANRFKRFYAAGTFRRSNKPGAKEFPRSPNRVRGVLRKLSALWSKHFRELGYVRANPWEEVAPPPLVRKTPDVPADDTVAAFFAYLAERFPKWPTLRLFCELKALSACRTFDLCQLRSDQVRGGRLVFDADQVKGRAGRSLPLPADLSAALEAVKGKAYLWERFPAEAAAHRKARGRGAGAHAGGFDPRSLAHTIGNVFREFNRSRPGRPRLLPHGLRRRAITLATLATQSVDAAAQAIGVNPATARAHYLDARRAFDSDALFTKLAGVLRPQAEPEGKG